MLLHSLPSPSCHANEAFHSPPRISVTREIHNVAYNLNVRGWRGNWHSYRTGLSETACGFQPHRLLSQPGRGMEPRPVSGCRLEVSQRKGTDLATRRLRLRHTRLSLSIHIFAYKNIRRAYQSRCFAMNWNHSSQLTENVIANRLNRGF